jgi:hypothetical protein
VLEVPQTDFLLVEHRSKKVQVPVQMQVRRVVQTD